MYETFFVGIPMRRDHVTDTDLDSRKVVTVQGVDN